MRPTPDGYQPSPGFLAEQMQQMDEFEQATMPSYEVVEHVPLIDSSNMTPTIWMKIANQIEDRYDQFDGFVVLHGTDTMAFTASALAFAMQGLQKPVIFTGAQLPLGQIRSDARENLKTAMVLAADYPIPEVTIFFGDELLRGCRSTKVSATRFDAFASPNYPTLALAGTSIEVYDEHVFRRTDTQLAVHEIRPAEISAFRIFPGLPIDIFRHVLQRPLKGIVIETYGDGNGPTNDPAFLDAIREAVDAGMIIMGCTQCTHGGMTQTGYAPGTALTKAGVIPGKDMTIEACLTKMMYLFSQGIGHSEIKRLLGQNIVGELTLEA